jgi:hypothetical protein
MQANNEIMISSGLHQFQHGQIIKVDAATEIPFAHVRLRNKNGELSKLRGAYVPLKYCVEIGKECAAAVRALAKSARKARLPVIKKITSQALANAKPLDWK